jgi:hypothetical protein
MGNQEQDATDLLNASKIRLKFKLPAMPLPDLVVIIKLSQAGVSASWVLLPTACLIR